MESLEAPIGRYSIKTKIESVVVSSHAWFFALEGVGARFWCTPADPMIFKEGDLVKVTIEKVLPDAQSRPAP